MPGKTGFYCFLLPEKNNCNKLGLSRLENALAASFFLLSKSNLVKTISFVVEKALFIII